MIGRELGIEAEVGKGIGEEIETAPTTMIETENMVVTATVSGTSIVIEDCMRPFHQIWYSSNFVCLMFLYGWLLVWHLLKVASFLSDSYVDFST